jgi:hypothetical protein
MNIADDEYSLIANRHRHGAAWDHVPLTEQPSNLRASWPVWASAAGVWRGCGAGGGLGDRVNYDQLDALILKRCAASPVTFNVLRFNDEIEDAAYDVAKPGRFGHREPFRVVDRRLQALRKRGLLTYSRADGWRAAPIRADRPQPLPAHSAGDSTLD